MMRQILSALEYLHKQQIIHRDIKTLNIMVGQDDSLMLGDLGVSKLIQTDLALYSRVGTPLYLAPEIIKYEKYDFKADVWGAGCIAYILATLSHPFEGKNIISLGQNIVSSEPKHINSFLASTTKTRYSDELAQLITDMLQKNPSKRLSVNELLQKYYAGF